MQRFFHALVQSYASEVTDAKLVLLWKRIPGIITEVKEDSPAAKCIPCAIFVNPTEETEFGTRTISVKITVSVSCSFHEEIKYWASDASKPIGYSDAAE